jgi:peptide/nickel transport system permease protein
MFVREIRDSRVASLFDDSRTKLSLLKLMAKPILYRLFQTILVLLVISLLTFALLAAAGGDALTTLAGDPKVSSEAIAELRRVYGLDQPLVLRYARWLGAAARGDFGYSFYFQLPVQTILWPRLMRTTVLAGAALTIAWIVAFVLGIQAARRRGSWVDRLCSVFVLLGSSVPRLVLALFVLVLAARAPRMNIGGLSAATTAAEWVWQLMPPALVLSIPLAALFLAQTRAAVAGGLKSEFVRTAQAKGLPRRMILFRHVLRPSLNPLITVFGYSLGGVMSGSVIVERVLGYPGLGELSVIAVQSRDVPLVLGVVLFTATAVLMGNLLADILLRLNDPRLR